MDITGIDLFDQKVVLPWIWLVIKASSLLYHYSINCEMSSAKHDWTLSEVLLPIAIMDLIGNWKIKYYHTTALSPYMVVTWLNTTTFEWDL